MSGRDSIKVNNPKKPKLVLLIKNASQETEMHLRQIRLYFSGKLIFTIGKVLLTPHFNIRILIVTKNILLQKLRLFPRV